MDSKDTPGYFGHLELAKPVYHHGFINNVVRVLRCVGYSSSKLLLDKVRPPRRRSAAGSRGARAGAIARVIRPARGARGRAMASARLWDPPSASSPGFDRRSRLARGASRPARGRIRRRSREHLAV
eukprot:30000-Pelagococcus_subviridis.AAC.3